jgi:predicted RNA-binding protein with RPS1 domain
MIGEDDFFHDYDGGGGDERDKERDKERDIENPRGRLDSYKLTAYRGGGGGGSCGKPPELYSIHKGRVKTIKPFGAFIAVRFILFFCFTRVAILLFLSLISLFLRSRKMRIESASWCLTHSLCVLSTAHAFLYLWQIDGFDRDGLLHIGNISNTRLEKVEDVLEMGESVWVKVTSHGEEGKYSVDMRNVSQSDGRDKDPSNISIEDKRGRGGHGRSGPIRLDAVLNTKCTRCGGYARVYAVANIISIFALPGCGPLFVLSFV